MKLKFYFYFQLTEHFFRKRRNHLAETNSWSSPQGTKQWDSSGLQSSWKLCSGGKTSSDRNSSSYRSHILTQALGLCSSHSHLSKEPHRDFVMEKELKQCWGWDKHLEEGASCSSTSPEQQFPLVPVPVCPWLHTARWGVRPAAHSYCSHVSKHSSDRNAPSWRQQHCSLPSHRDQTCFTTRDGREVVTGISQSELWSKVPN